jgi:uncharacterized metal-binding protein
MADDNKKINRDDPRVGALLGYALDDLAHILEDDKHPQHKRFADLLDKHHERRTQAAQPKKDALDDLL